MLPTAVLRCVQTTAGKPRRVSRKVVCSSRQQRAYASLNKVMLSGHVGNDPDTKSFEGGGSVTSFNLAVGDYSFDKKANQMVPKTEWFRISVFNDRLQEVVQKNVTKGALVYVEGQLKIRKWKDSVGIEKTSPEIQVKVKGDLIVFKKGGEAGERRERDPGAGHPEDEETVSDER